MTGKAKKVKSGTEYRIRPNEKLTVKKLNYAVTEDD